MKLVRLVPVMVALALWAESARAEAPPSASDRIDALIESASDQPETQSDDGTWGASAEAGALHDAILRGDLSDAQWERLLERSNILPSHSKWLADTPITLRPMAPGWLGEGGVIRLSIVGYLSGKEARTAALQGNLHLTLREVRQFRDTLTIDALPLGDQEIRCHVSVEVRSRDRRTVVRRKGAFARSISVVESGALPAIVTPELDAAVRNAVEISLSEDAKGFTRVDARGHNDTEALAAFDGIGLNAVVEVLDEEGSVVTTDHVSLNRISQGNFIYTITINGTPHEPAIPTGGAAKGWTVRVRGDERAALVDGRFDSYWGGEYTIPLTDVLMAE